MGIFQTKCPKCGEPGISLRRRALAHRWSGLDCDYCGTKFRPSALWALIGSILFWGIFPLWYLIFIWVPWIELAVTLAALLLILAVCATGFLPLVEKSESEKTLNYLLLLVFVPVSLVLFFLVPDKELALGIIFIAFIFVIVGFDTVSLLKKWKQ